MRLCQKVGALATKVGWATSSTQSKKNVNANAASMADYTAMNVAKRCVAIVEQFSADTSNKSRQRQEGAVESNRGRHMRGTSLHA
jgi:hypothetical protein